MMKRKIVSAIHLKKYVLFLMSVSLFISCVGDQSVAKRKGVVKDFSTTKSANNGCGELFLIFEKPYDNCTTECLSGTHPASLTELSALKKELVDSEGSAIDGLPATDLLSRVNGSANVCIEDVIVELRPTNAIDIKSDFCSCIAGKPDILANCESICASKPNLAEAILYVNTTPNADIVLNTKLGNLQKWCSVQLANDVDSAQCSVIATDGVNTVSLPPNIGANSNSFSVNVSTLAKNRTWILKIQETRTGSNAQSKEFQLRRIDQPSSIVGTIGALKVTPINQYTCMTYGGKVDALGNIIRNTFARLFYYFASNETPAPIPPPGGTSQSTVVCHDDQLHVGNDSALYERLELIPGAFTLWDRSDTRFVAKAENGGKMTISKMIEERLVSEYSYSATNLNINLFTDVTFPNRPSTSTTSGTKILLGLMMLPFADAETGKSYCPTSTHFNSDQPLFNILGEYMSDTEGLFLSEKEGETIQEGSTYKTVYALMLVKESTLKNYGFYIENGLKIKADANSMNSKTIYFYWPTSTIQDALTQGNRRLFTVRSYDNLNGNTVSAPATTERTSDKRIGCVPKS
jgi:hypothetical protein